MAILNGNTGNDDLFGTAQADTINGGAGDDTLTGHGGADLLNGQDGNDALIGGAGADTLSGGAGTDKVLYYREPGTQGVRVDLGAGTAIDATGDTDRLSSIEQVYGTARPDTLLGADATGDVLFGREGADSLNGRGGNDILVGDAGADTLDGGAGASDQVSYFLETGTRGVQVNLEAGTAVDTHGTVDTLRNIEQVYGSNLGDTLNGAAGSNDRLFGRAGNDVINGLGGNDILVGGAGNDTIAGGAGDDQVAYFLETGTRGVQVNLQAGSAVDTFGNTDILTSIERVYGSNAADTIIGADPVRDLLFGRGGDDTINGGGENDTVVGDAGDDTLNGGDGKDQVAYFLETGTRGVNVDLRAGTATDTHGDNDTLIDVEYVFGSDTGDTILGTDVDGDRLFGRGGSDLLDGRDGDNLILTGSGNDTVRVGTTTYDARDTIVIDGGGTKTITGTGSEGTRYGHHIVFRVDSGVTVNLKDGIATSNGMRTDFTQALWFLEVNGSASDDLIVGGNLRHEDLEWYVGFQGEDTLDGATGTGDTVVYDDEVIIGQFNYVTGRHEYGDRGVVVNLATGVATDAYGYTDTLINIDQIRATEFADNLVGSAEDNGFWALEGADTVRGAGGFDRIHYDEDYLTGGNRGVVVDLAAGTGIDGFGDTDTLISIEGVHATQYNDRVQGDDADNRLFGKDGRDTLSGGAGDDVILGGAGNDTLSGGLGDDELWGDAGNDTLNGGAGTDVARYREADTGINANLISGVVADGEGGFDTLISIENLHGSDQNDRVQGNVFANQVFGYGGNDTLNTGAGNDVVLGGTGDDSIDAGAGDDEIRGEIGNDTLDGGAGVDVARYLDAAAGINVNLISGVAVDGDGGTDTLRNIENVHGSTHGDRVQGDIAANQIFGLGGNDTLLGASGNDVILGGDGNDSIDGGANDDEIRGEAGNDTLDGGAGFDVARYLDAAVGINVNLISGQAMDGDGGLDTLRNVEGVHGSTHGDRVQGDIAANQIFGLGGNDTLLGASGNDVILGGDGNDSIDGGANDDEIRGEAGNDTLDGGAGFDVARYLDAAAGINVNLISGQAMDGDGGLDTLRNVEGVHGSAHGDRVTGDANDNQIFGFAGADTLMGAGGTDTILGGAGNDALEGNAGDDELWGEAGDDTIDGGTGSDLVRYRGDTAGVTVNLTTGRATDGWGGTDTLVSIERVHVSEYNDTVTGDGADNRIFGFGGNDSLLGAGGGDIILGGAGADTIRGGDGDDEIWGEAGADTLDGGAGSDLVRYLNEARGVTVDLATGRATDGSGGIDTLVSIERVHGSGFGDVISGNGAANRIFGFGGADTLDGRGGADIVLGGDGNDLLRGGDGDDQLWGELGTDTIDGGNGADVVRYLNSPGAITVDLVAGTAQDGFGYTDTLRNIEHIHASDHDDRLDGSGAGNQIFGYVGADTIRGGAGADTLSGGVGGDTYVFFGGDGYDIINDLGTTTGGADTVVINGYLSQNARVYHQNPADPNNKVVVLDFGVSGDVVVMANTLDAGHAGAIERVVFADGETWTHTDLIAAFNQTTVAASLNPTSGGDALTGTVGNDTIDGLGGDDIVNGVQGDDLLRGGVGSDTIRGGDGDNTLDGGTGDDVLVGGNGADSFVLRLGMGQDQALDFQYGTDWLDASALTASQRAAITVQPASGADRVVTLADGSTLTLKGDPNSATDNAANIVLDGATTEDATLSARVTGLTDLYGFTPDDVVIQWLRDGQAVSGATGQTYLLGQSDVGTTITARATYTDANNAVQQLVSNATGAIANLNDAPAGTVAITGTAEEDQVLRVSTDGLADEDGLGTLGYQWMRNSVAVDGATENRFALGQDDVDASISVQIRYTDGQGTVETLTSAGTDAVRNVNDAPEGGVAITGTALEGSTLHAASTLSDADGMGELSYQWRRDGVDIAGATGADYVPVTADIGAQLTVVVRYADGEGRVETVGSVATEKVGFVNSTPTGEIRILGTMESGETLTADTSALADVDGLGTLALEWLRDGTPISGAAGTSYTLVQADAGAAITLRVSYTDDRGSAESVLSQASAPVRTGNQLLTGTDGDDVLRSLAGNDTLLGLDGNDQLVADEGDDSLRGGDGADTLNAGAGNDTIYGGETEADLRDIIYAGAGDDWVDAGYGNDQLNGGEGNDTLAGGFGADEVIGQQGDDVLTGSAFGDVIFGGDGFDFINGGFGHDRVNGGADGDRFFHLGVFDHGSDWIQDYDAADGDVLQFGQAGARADQFQVNITNTANAGAAAVDEAFVIYKPTGQIMWALVDGAGQGAINLSLGGQVFDLM